MKLWLAMFLVAFSSVGAGVVQAAPLINGDFEAHPTDLLGWTVDGVAQVITLGEEMNRVALIQENPAGASSRFYQEFELPADPTCLSFRFVMIASPFTCPTGSAHADSIQGETPPDAMLAFLTTADTLERLVVPAECEPTFTEAFFWMDNDDLTPPQYCDELNLVGVTEITPLEFATVSLDVSSLTGGQTVRIEFGMADGCDGQNTQIIVDDVMIESATSERPSNCAGLAAAVPAVSNWGILITGLFLAVVGTRMYRLA